LLIYIYIPYTPSLSLSAFFASALFQAVAAYTNLVPCDKDKALGCMSLRNYEFDCILQYAVENTSDIGKQGNRLEQERKKAYFSLARREKGERGHSRSGQKKEIQFLYLKNNYRAVEPPSGPALPKVEKKRPW